MIGFNRQKINQTTEVTSVNQFYNYSKIIFYLDTSGQLKTVVQSKSTC